jgi:hypothetical protein
MHRIVFDRYGPFREGCFSSDSAFNWKAGAELGESWLTPEIEVRHSNYTRLGKVFSKLYQHSRDFARLRASENGWSRARTAFHAATFPLLPMYLFVRAFLNVVSSRTYLGRFVAVSPLVLLGFTIWSVGECSGYLSQLGVSRGSTS